MAQCVYCRHELKPGSRFCQSCGRPAPVPQLPPRDIRLRAVRTDWYTLQQVLYQRDKLPGAIGVVLVFFGAFLPWSSVTFNFGFWAASLSLISPLAVLFALAALVAGVILFRRGLAELLLVIGALLGAWALISALIGLSSSATPSWGMLLTLAGGVCLVYSGLLTRQYENR